MAGATGQLLAALGRSAFGLVTSTSRSATRTHRRSTTQIYFEGDPWIDSDVGGAVKASLVAKLAWHDDRECSYATCSYDFVLPAAHATR